METSTLDCWSLSHFAKECGYKEGKNYVNFLISLLQALRALLCAAVRCHGYQPPGHWVLECDHETEQAWVLPSPLCPGGIPYLPLYLANSSLLECRSVVTSSRKFALTSQASLASLHPPGPPLHVPTALLTGTSILETGSSWCCCGIIHFCFLTPYWGHST